VQLSLHFSLEELVHSDTAERRGIKNVPDQTVLTNLAVLAEHLEEIRDILGGLPITVLSGFRCAALNSLVGGSPLSDHMKGLAADILCRDFGSPFQVATKLANSGLKFDQLIQEGSWVHISFREPPRRQILTATFKDGRAIYSNGL
jgi:hypothetical protein